MRTAFFIAVALGCNGTTAMKTKKHTKVKVPKLSAEEAAEMARAARFAFANERADAFFDETMAEAMRLRKLRRDRKAFSA